MEQILEGSSLVDHNFDQEYGCLVSSVNNTEAIK